MLANFNEICYFWSASVDIRPLPRAWVADLLGVVLGDLKNEISHQKYQHIWHLKGQLGVRPLRKPAH